MFVTLTVMRGAHYLTVVCTYNHAYGWVVDASIDEYGNTVTLTEQERSEAIRRASEGEDDTGR